MRNIATAHGNKESDSKATDSLKEEYARVRRRFDNLNSACGMHLRFEDRFRRVLQVRRGPEEPGEDGHTADAIVEHSHLQEVICREADCWQPAELAPRCPRHAYALVRELTIEREHWLGLHAPTSLWAPLARPLSQIAFELDLIGGEEDYRLWGSEALYMIRTLSDRHWDEERGRYYDAESDVAALIAFNSDWANPAGRELLTELHGALMHHFWEFRVGSARWSVLAD